MKKSKLFVLLMVVLMVAFALVGCGDGQTNPSGSNKPSGDDKPLKVGVVVIGSTQDKGYTYAHARGMDYVKSQLGGKVEIIYRDNVDDTNAQATTAAIESLIEDDKCTVIFTNSFGFMEPTAAAAEKYKDVKFFHCSGYMSNGTNFVNYFGRAYQARYLAGIAAGKATKTNKIGYVAAQKITEVYRGINAFTLGVQSVNPNATVYVNWTGTWYDPTLEKEAAKSLLQAGCDCIAQHQDTMQPGYAAAEAKAYSLGCNSPMLESNPEGYLTGPTWDWGIYYLEQIKAILDGTWKAENVWRDMASGVAKLDEFGPSVTDETKQLIADTKAKIVNGEWDVFTGPIYDNKGELRVADGEKMTDEQMLSTDFTWFVKGATDEGIQG